ncbi:MAG: winged helix-turn-helix transcriptional regulator [Anaerolineales bacterium]|nr:winged helix-turn-helix transcriptional regulator [Anaerolineales bacterium]
MSEIVFDDIDRAIINLLQSNARLSAVDITSQLDVINPRMVRYRIEKLAQAGIISFTTVINTKALNFPNCLCRRQDNGRPYQIFVEGSPASPWCPPNSDPYCAGCI